MLRSRRRAPTASAHGAWTWAPYGGVITIRQGRRARRGTSRPGSSCRWAGWYRLALLVEEGHAEVVGGPRVEAGVATALHRLVVPERGRPGVNASIARPRPPRDGRRSPFQNGQPARLSWAGTSTRSWVMSSIRQLPVPSANTSPTWTRRPSPRRAHRPGWPPRRPGTPRTGRGPGSCRRGHQPAAAPGPGGGAPVTRSHTIRGRSSANSSLG